MKQLFFILLLSIPYFSFSQYEDAIDPFPVCGNGEISFDGISGTGSILEEFPTSSFCPLDQNATKWLKIKILEAGTLAFVINPNNSEDDYDFGLFGPNPNPNNLSRPIRSSYARPDRTNRTGLKIVSTFNESCENSDGDQFVDHIEVTKGQEYLILVDNFSARAGSVEPFQLMWRGTAELDCSIVVGNLGDDQEVCIGDIITLDGTVEEAVNYTWYIDEDPDDRTDNFTLIENENGPTLTISDNRTGIYRLEYSNGVATSHDDVLVRFFSPPEVTDASRTVCSATNEYTFNLSDFNNEITPVPRTTVTYHETIIDANYGLNALANNYTTATTTLFARAERPTNCYSIAELDLTINQAPILNDAELEACSDTNSVAFNLNDAIPQITNNDPALTVTFYPDRLSANNKVNPITNVTDYTAENRDYIFAVAETSNCSSTARLSFNVQQNPTIPINSVSTCSDSSTATFSIDDIIAEFETENTSTSLQIFETRQQAQDNVNALSGNITNSTNPQTLYGREDNGSCTNIIEFQLIVNERQNFENVELFGCSSTAVATFDLAKAIDLIDLDNKGYAISFYETLEDANAQENNLEQMYKSPEKNIFARIEGGDLLCTSFTQIRLTPTVLQKDIMIREAIEICYGEYYTLPDGRRIYEEGSHDIVNRETCTIERFNFTMALCDNGFCTPKIPKAFSPNNDGVNDLLKLFTPDVCNMQITSVTIMNKWGQVVFKSDGSEYWNGNFNGAQAETGLYLYIVEFKRATDTGEQSELYTGAVNLIR